MTSSWRPRLQRGLGSRPTPPDGAQRFGLQYYQMVKSMLFAIEEINNNTNLLPNITLGFQIYDTCTMLQRSLKGTLWILSGHEEPIPNFRCQRSLPPAAIIGESISTHSISIAHILGQYRYPQVSYLSTSPLLSDRNQFPSFFRTIPSDDFQYGGLAQLVTHFGWTWVGIVASGDNYGQLGSQLVQQEIIKNGACVAFTENIILSRVDKNVFHIAQVIKNSAATAIVIFSSTSYLIPLLDEMVRQNVTGKTWIASEGWSTSYLVPFEKYSELMSSTIGLAMFSGEMVGFQEYFMRTHPSKAPEDIFVRRFWEEAFGCQWLDEDALMMKDNKIKKCTGDEKLESLPISNNMDVRTTYNIYKAVYATVLALKDLMMCIKGGGPFIQETCANISDFHPWQLLCYIKRVRLSREDTEPFFDEHGNPPARYDIVNWQPGPKGTIRHVKVGSYDTSVTARKTFMINSSIVQWNTKNTQVPVSVCSPSCPKGFRKVIIPGKPVCCFQCLQCRLGEISNQTDSIECFKCPWDQWSNENRDQCIPKNTDFLSYEETFGAILAASSIFSSVIPIIIMGLFFCYRNTPIVKANNTHLSFLLLVSLTLCFLCSLTFIGWPTEKKCLIRQAAFGTTFALCVSSILAKTFMVVIAFKATKPNSNLRRWVGPKLSYTIIIAGTLIQVVLCALWLLLTPPFSDYNIHVYPGLIIVECNEGSPIAFWSMLGYLGLLATISFIVAFLARKLPDSFNEARFITFSMLAFLSVWLSFIPAYLSTRGKYMVAMEIFAILSSSSSLVSCLFFPKCYIILFRSEMNTKDYLMGRDASQRKVVKRI
ncbi:extracellular calcium-sensing receptor-like [Pleurodeles waltl]|uniref:extracellular calcium-sensing receptor-like n=1 Tax=Pleurodeles waltl TaxID=8319 RepID=UPI00370974A3